MSHPTFTRPRVHEMPPRLAAKWSEYILNEGFIAFPKRLLRSLGTLFPKSKEIEQLAVILAIVDYRRPNMSRLPSVDFLAFLTGLPKQRVELRLRELFEKGWRGSEDAPDGVDVDITGFLDAIKAAAPDEE